MPDINFNNNLYTFGSDGKLVNNNTVWDDLRVPINAVKLQGSNDPTFVQFADDSGLGDTGTSTGVYVYSFSASSTNEVFFNMQMPHAWLEGSAIKMHVHWAPATTNTGDCRWALEYNKAIVAGTYAGTTTIYVNDAADGTVGKHQIAAFADISMTSDTLSTMIICRLYREGGDAADTFTGAAYFLGVDAHIEFDSMGSQAEYSK